MLEQIRPETSAGGQNDKTEAELLRAHQEEAGFFGKGNNVGEERRQPKRRKTSMSRTASITEATGMSLQEWSRAAEHGTL